MEHLRCVVERITYQNADNGYTVLKCAVKNYSDLVTVVGTMPDTHVGSVLFLEGMWKMDAKYGRQFSAERMEETLPATVYGIEKYLGSGLSAIEEQKLKEIDNDLLWYDLKYLLNETPDTPKPVVHVPIQYRQYPFSQVEEEYRNLFDQLSAKICK